MDDSQRQQQEEEILVLQSIYGSDAVRIKSDHCMSIQISGPGDDALLLLHFILPLDYPQAAAPILEIESSHLESLGVLGELNAQLESMFCPGEVVLFEYIEYVRQRWEELKPAPILVAEEQVVVVVVEDTHQQPPSMSDDALMMAAQLDNINLIQDAYTTELESNIIHGEPFTVQKSTFQAHVCSVTDVDQVKAVVDILLLNNKIRQATHNIMAYRIEREDKPGVFAQDCDDDGESAAGGRLLHMLQMADVRNAVVIVSRWFGGVKLGPSRFGHINNVARQLLDECGFIQKKSSSRGSKR